MSNRRVVPRVVLACLLVVAVALAGSGVVLAAQDEGEPSGSAFEGIEQFLQQLDEFLETVVDLLRTVRALGGEGGGD